MSSDYDSPHHSGHGLTLDLQGVFATHDHDSDTASQHSISFASPTASTSTSPHHSPKLPTFLTSDTSRRQYTISTESSDDPDDASPLIGHANSFTSHGESVLDHDGGAKQVPTILLPAALERSSFPPLQPWNPGRSSVASLATKKARPESLLDLPNGPLILGIALVDFNHQVGPRIQSSFGSIFEDEEINKILPFLAIPDGTHLAAEDYSYFHLVPSVPNPSTIFGISCNRQIATSSLLIKEVDMTRSTVQKAVVILASRPVFGPIRDRLGVVTLALFEQKDFTNTDLLFDFYQLLQGSLQTQLTESGLYMGTSLRELVHKFRHHILVLVKALILQKKILFHGHPVERLCTYQYSLISLIPGLLQTLQDCGSPPLASRAPTLVQPTSMWTWDRRSLLAYLGLPLNLFGKDAFFQPYLPLQQLDLIKFQTRSFLCGSTNAIVRQQNDIELLVDIETCSIEFRDPKIERAVALTPADKKWVDQIVKDVNGTWDTEDTGMRRFKGSDDYVRIKFEEYICAALASFKYGDFLAKGDNSGVLITAGSGGDSNAQQDFNPIWIAEFRRTNAFDVWQRVTDPMLFDIIEPRHPCNEKPSAISDITLRLSEGLQDLKLEQQLAPMREATSHTINAGSTNFFKAVEGVEGRFMQQTGSTTSVGSTSPSSGMVLSSTEIPDGSAGTTTPPTQAAPAPAGINATTMPTKGRLSGWGASARTLFSTQAARFSSRKMSSLSASAPSSTTGSPVPHPAPWMPSSKASISGSTGDVGHTLVTKTPPPEPASTVDLGERTPQGIGSRFGGDAECQGPAHELELEHEKAGDSDEQLLFGVPGSPFFDQLPPAQIHGSHFQSHPFGEQAAFSPPRPLRAAPGNPHANQNPGTYAGYALYHGTHHQNRSRGPYSSHVFFRQQNVGNQQVYPHSNALQPWHEVPVWPTSDDGLVLQAAWLTQAAAAAPPQGPHINEAATMQINNAPAVVPEATSPGLSLGTQPAGTSTLCTEAPPNLPQSTIGPCPYPTCNPLQTWGRRQELERHVLRHLPHHICCPYPSCGWSGSRHYPFVEHYKKKHLKVEAPDSDVPEALTYNAKPLAKRLVNGEITMAAAIKEADTLVRKKVEWDA